MLVRVWAPGPAVDVQCTKMGCMTVLGSELLQLLHSTDDLLCARERTIAALRQFL
jgi:hypothetical protein